MVKLSNMLIALSGVMAIFIFIAALFIGGSTYPAYSQFKNEISLLFSRQAPTRDILAPLILLYSLAIVFVAGGLYMRSKNGITRLGAAFLLMYGLSGIGTWYFPMDHIGPPLTVQGTLHLFFVGIMAFSVVFAMLYLGISFRHFTGLKWLYPISFLFSVFLATSAVWGVLSVVVRDSLLGLFERLPFMTFLLWLLLLSYGMLGSDKRIKHYFKL